MSVTKKIERLVKSMILAPRVLIRYGQLRPSRVRLVGCDHWVHIDPTDRRALKKFIQDPLRGRVSPPSAFWSAFNKHLKPAVVVDVGVNYGECLFGTRYHDKTRIFGFEANPRLVSLLEKSCMEHPDSERMTLTYGLVSDKIAENIPFYVNPIWSGGASAISELNSGMDTLTFEIKALTIDSVIPRELVINQCLLFKMDIEGYESRAFGGFNETLDAAALAVGFIEFDSNYIMAAGENPDTYFQRLSQRFTMYRLKDLSAQTIVRVGDYTTLPRMSASDDRVHTDLILVTKNASPTSWLASGWSIR